MPVWVGDMELHLAAYQLCLPCQLETIVSDDPFGFLTSDVLVLDFYVCVYLCYRHSDEWCVGFWCSSVTFIHFVVAQELILKKWSYFFLPRFNVCHKLIEELASGKLQRAYFALAWSLFILNIFFCPSSTYYSRNLIEQLAMATRVYLALAHIEQLVTGKFQKVHSALAGSSALSAMCCPKNCIPTQPRHNEKRTASELRKRLLLQLETTPKNNSLIHNTTSFRTIIHLQSQDTKLSNHRHSMATIIRLQP